MAAAGRYGFNPVEMVQSITENSMRGPYLMA